MKKIALILISVLICSTYSYGQKEIELYKKIYKVSDSLKAIGQISNIDTTLLFKKVKELDNKHPSEFFKTAGEYLAISKFNEAAFIYNLGLMRYRYYNSANPEYQISNDGALLGSLKSVIGEPVNMFLRTDIDNYISIIKITLHYYINNDFSYFSKEKNITKSDELIKSYNDMISELQTNKEKYKLQWTDETKTMKGYIDKLIEAQKEQKEK